jgi:hypothetical protein
VDLVVDGGVEVSPPAKMGTCEKVDEVNRRH